MLLNRGGLRLLDTFNFVSGARQTLDLQVPQRFIQRLWIWVQGTLTISAVTVPGTIHTDGPVNIVQQLELLLNGKTRKFGSGAAFFRVAQMYDQSEGVNDGLVSANAGVYTFEALIPLLFEAPSSVSPIDTLVDGRTIKNMILNLTWGTTANLVVGNTSTLAISACTAEVYIDDTDPFPTKAPFWEMRETEHQFLGILTSGGTRLPIPFTPGHVVRAILLRAIDGAEVSDAVINRLSLRLNGEEMPLNSLEDDFVQALQQHQFGRDSMPDGYYMIELAENGRVASTGLGAGGKPITDIEIVADTTVGAGATSIVAHTIEHVPPGA